MTCIRAFVSAFAPPRRSLAAAVALASLVLTGCGSDKPGATGSRGEPGGGTGSRSSAPQSSPEQAAFAAMLDKVAQPCSSTVGAASGPTDEKPTGPEGKPSLAPGETPPTAPVEPGAPAEPAAGLSPRDACASVQHEQRIIQSLQAVSQPTPAKVLNTLGYLDERIHGLEQDGKATRFHLDLREKGGQLREAGHAAGEQTDMTACTAPATGPFTVTTTAGRQP
ncbi:hypothetical protein ACFVTC_15490 [Streptomyces sp. NPDC057950]|uniref:hypothetical protein n=1 Tax=Streptomyces sp. NPDC057950 TaxID=3346288 RepID=UPI0036E090C2